jgi:hypothetical protein
MTADCFLANNQGFWARTIPIAAKTYAQSGLEERSRGVAECNE